MNTSVETYYARLESMTHLERAEHLRNDYRDQHHEWPDYLDYVDDWKYLYREKLSLTRKDFIFTALALRKQTIPCGNHFHTFSTTPQATDTIVITRPDAYMDVTSCWYKTIFQTDEQIAPSILQSAITLAVPESEWLKRMVGLRLIQEGSTATQLSFDEFSTLWWGKESKTQAIRILHASQPPHIQAEPSSTPIEDAKHKTVQAEPFSIEAEVAEMRMNLPAPIAKWAIPGSGTILPIDNVLSDHGLHLLMLARTDWIDIFHTIINMRKPYDHGSTTTEDLGRHMNMCYRCQRIARHAKIETPSDQFAYIRPNSTFPGVYYAPPGNGKTTVMERGLFIGIDTDWLLRNSDFNNVIAPFLKFNLPIITNQYGLAVNAGQKFIGCYSPSLLRTDDSGQPYTTQDEVELASELFKQDACFYKTDGYVYDNLVQLIRLQYLYTETRYVFMGKTYKHKFKDNKTHDPVDITEFIRNIFTDPFDCDSN